jgi:GPI mannosyltransferase 3
MNIQEPQANTRTLKKLGFYCLLCSVVWHIIAAWFSIGFYHPDEFFQVFEFAGYKAGVSPPATMPWELKAMVRPAIQPALIYFFQNVTQGYFSPSSIQFICRLFSALLGIFSLALITIVGIKILKDEASKKFLILVSAFLWFFPFVHARFSSENIAGSLIFISIACLLFYQLNHKKYLLPIAGFVTGLAFDFRVQVVFMILGIMAWAIFIARFSIKELFTIGFPALVAVLIGLLIDRWFYGQWVLTAWKYFQANIVQGKAASYGMNPWWSYFQWVTIDLVIPFSIIIIIGIFYSFIKYPANLVVLAVFPFILAHIFIAHKELRFLFPIINGLPFLLSLAYQSVKDILKIKQSILQSIFMVWILIHCFILVFSSLTPADDRFGVHQYIYDHYDKKDLTMISHAESPYAFGFLPDYFDRPRGMKQYQFASQKQVDSLLLLSKSPAVVIFEYRKDATSFTRKHPGAKLVYRFIPAWIDPFDFNHWMDRTKIWYVYEF